MPGKKVIAFPGPKKQKPKRDKSQKAPAAKLERDAVFSFLKDTRGVVSWTARDLADTLGVTLAQANDALPVLEMQGYVSRSGKNEWLTTIEGETVSGSVAPRYKKDADVGIEAAVRAAKGTPQRPSAALLSTLKAKSPMLHLLPFAPWMVNRTHRKLL